MTQSVLIASGILVMGFACIAWAFVEAKSRRRTRRHCDWWQKS